MAVKPTPTTAAGANSNSSRFSSQLQHIPRTRFLYPGIRASLSTDDKSKVFKELGLFALRKKIEDAVHRAEALAPTAIELEEAQRIRREEVVRECHLWDDPAQSSEVLVEFAHSAKVVDSLKDLKYKAEEAKLIAELVETDAVNHHLFRHAYSASVDVSKLLDQYEMSKILRGPFDMHGASLVIKAQDQDSSSQIWAECLLNMYLKWAEKQGHRGRVIEKCISRSGGISFASIELEFGYAYGYLLGERGVHQMLGSREPSLAAVDVVPLFLESFPDLALDEEDIRISYESSREHEHGTVEASVFIQHLPTGISVQSCGERSQFANKMKALNRLKAKLLVILWEQGLSTVQSIMRDAIIDPWKQETRRMGVCLSVGRGSEDAKTDQPRLGFPLPQRCFEVGGPSSPPEDVKYVLPESVVLVDRSAMVPELEPVPPPRVGEVQEEEHEDELSRYEQGVYRDEFLLGPISEETEFEEEDEELLEIVSVADEELIEVDPGEEDSVEANPEDEEEPFEDESEEVEPFEDEPEGDPVMDHVG